MRASDQIVRKFLTIKDIKIFRFKRINKNLIKKIYHRKKKKKKFLSFFLIYFINSLSSLKCYIIASFGVDSAAYLAFSV